MERQRTEQPRTEPQVPEPPADLVTDDDVEPAPVPGRMSLPGALTFHGARRWYVGSIFCIGWLGLSAYQFFRSTSDPLTRVIGIALMVVFAVAIAVAVPFAWWLPARWRWLSAAGLWATSFVLVPVLGWTIVQTWVFVGIVIGMSAFTMRMTFLLGGILVALVILFQHWGGVTGEGAVWTPALIASLTLMMAGFTRQIAAIAQLRATQHELARVAVERERGRVARDIHDILGHSLTTIAVKAELAGMLVESGDPRAAAEIAAVRDIARGALADVRSTVSGYRGMSAVAELAGARSVLASAGIEADLPATVDIVSPERRELAGWVIREGITNVLRHSDATVCRVRVDDDVVEVADDGVGPDAAAEGNGLRGLSERVALAGGVLHTGRSELGGFLLRVELGAER